MSLYDQIVKVYPELKDQVEIFQSSIRLADDSDGFGEFIVSWDYDQPIPKGMKIGK